MNKKVVLFVEDEEDLRVLVSSKLRESGYEVLVAVDGEDALQMAQTTKVDVVVSDVYMPKKDGNQLFKELKATSFGKDVPFIVLTAHVHMKDYFEMIKADDFLEKPFKIEDLIMRIEKVLRRSGGEKE